MGRLHSLKEVALESARQVLGNRPKDHVFRHAESPTGNRPPSCIICTSARNVVKWKNSMFKQLSSWMFFSMCHIVPNDVCSLVATSFNHIAFAFTKAMFEHNLLHPCSFNCQQNRICTKKTEKIRKLSARCCQKTATMLAFSPVQNQHQW